MEDCLKDIDSSIKVLQEERSREISALKSQVVTQMARVEEYEKQVSALENTRIDHKSDCAARLISINNKYDSTRLKLTSQLKLLSKCSLVLNNKCSRDHHITFILHVLACVICILKKTYP